MLPKITSAMLIVTHSCNLACRYCFVHQEPSRMTFETAKAAADFLIINSEGTNEVPEINFFGGEPLLMWDSVIKPLTLYLREERKVPFNLSMTSNCTLITDERLAFMEKYNIGLLFSLDGAKETQDYNRPFHGGAGSFDALAPIIPKVLARYPGQTLRMTLIPATCHHMFENITWGEKQGYTNFFVIPNVFETWDAASRKTLSAELRKYGDYCISKYRADERPISFSSFNDALADIKRINSAEEKGDYRSLPKCRADGKCGLGANKFASIHPNGNIYGCQEMTSNEGEESLFYIGNLRTGVSEERRLKLMSVFSSHAVTGFDCGGCEFARICDGGCVANNYLSTGKLHEMPELFCVWKRIVITEAIRVMQVLGGEKNEAFKQLWQGLGV